MQDLESSKSREPPGDSMSHSVKKAAVSHGHSFLAQIESCSYQCPDYRTLKSLPTVYRSEVRLQSNPAPLPQSPVSASPLSDSLSYAYALHCLCSNHKVLPRAPKQYSLSPPALANAVTVPGYHFLFSLPR